MDHVTEVRILARQPERHTMSKSEIKVELCVVEARKCPHCDHHEVGAILPDGKFVPLRPGDHIDLYMYPNVIRRIEE